jgi:hypothetical protein
LDLVVFFKCLLKRKNEEVLGYSSAIEHLPSWRPLGSIPNTTKMRDKDIERNSAKMFHYNATISLYTIQLGDVFSCCSNDLPFRMYAFFFSFGGTRIWIQHFGTSKAGALPLKLHLQSGHIILKIFIKHTLRKSVSKNLKLWILEKH